MRSQTRPAERRPSGQTLDDPVVVEAPLEIHVEGTALAMTMRTPGDDLDLVAGFLLTEGVIDDIDDLRAIAHVGQSGNVVDAILASGVQAHQQAIARATRDRIANSACGICGKTTIEQIHSSSPPLARVAEVNDDVLLGLPASLRRAQPTFDSTGGVHAAGLFTTDGALLVVREDVGRHNAVDKVLGARLRAGADPREPTILLTSSRASFEIVQKAVVARIPIVAAVGAATTLAIDLARESRVVLVAFLRDGRFNRYT